MIHQFIFAGPKPGLSAEAFQSYWVNFHAVDYAAKIPQIKEYLVAPRLHINNIEGTKEVPFFEGVAEIWFENEQKQSASLRSPEFLQGARIDEPRWAAFWQTFVHDADPVTVIERKNEASNLIKLYTFLKRKSGHDLKDFKINIQDKHAELVANLPEIKEYIIGFAREVLYGLGEPRYDAIEVYSFCNIDELQTAITSNEMKKIEEGWPSIVEIKYLFNMIGKENWIIRIRPTATFL